MTRDLLRLKRFAGIFLGAAGLWGEGHTLMSSQVPEAEGAAAP